MISDMITVTLRVSTEIETHENAVVAAGMAKEPHTERMRRAKVLEATSRFLLLLEPYGTEISQMLTKAPKGKKQGS